MKKSSSASKTALRSSQVAGTNASSTLVASGAATLKPQQLQATQAPATQQKTIKFTGTSLKALTTQIETVWDGPTGIPEETRGKLEKATKMVNHMPALFEAVSHMKEEKRQFMDDMHQHALGKVEDVRVYMDNLLAELKGHIRDFSVEWDQKLGGAMDELDAELKERVFGLNTRFEALETRAKALHSAVDEETRARIRHVDSLLVPVRQQVQRLTEELERERCIREDRERELRDHLDDCVNRLKASLDNEIKNRTDRHGEAIRAALGQGEADEGNDAELPRLRRRQREMGQADDASLAKMQNGLDGDRDLRIKSQDHIASQISEFIQRFKAHVLEEGEAGN
eukprot:TRINITY_DN63149_c0_g1_i1.p1 TRINITY_DN63149_c0_g1~~TRINITY_DN63149_c0_g1_i1.p1  ORF type:complete len:370 (+),score=89.24 TRINITY_DN63149_c0_g1_i1:90-1112(+)